MDKSLSRNRAEEALRESDGLKVQVVTIRTPYHQCMLAVQLGQLVYFCPV